MKKIFILPLIIALCFLIIGCGKKDDENVNETNDNTKVTTITESYEKYVELKGKSYEKMSEKLTEKDPMLAFSFLGFASTDLLVAPIAICGLDDKTVTNTYAHLTGLVYKNENDKCTISYTEQGVTNSYEAFYDRNTDSLQTKITNDGELAIIFEYIKLDDGYAAMQYFADENEGTVYKSIFNDNYMAIGVFDNVSSGPNSIYKTKNVATKEWTQGGTTWAEFDNGELTTIPNN